MDALTQAVTDELWKIATFMLVMMAMLLALALLVRRLPRAVRVPAEAVLMAVVIYAAFHLVIA